MKDKRLRFDPYAAQADTVDLTAELATLLNGGDTVLPATAEHQAQQDDFVSPADPDRDDQIDRRPDLQLPEENSNNKTSAVRKMAHAALWLTGIRKGREKHSYPRYLRMAGCVAALAMIAAYGVHEKHAHTDPEAGMCPPVPVAAGPSFNVQSEQVQDGVEIFNYTSEDDGCGVHTLRVLRPTDPKPGVPHKFIIMLPVLANQNNQYGDGLDTARKLNAQNEYNATIIEPSFPIDPWYTDNPENRNLRLDTFMADDLAPWIRENLSTDDVKEQIWLVGFSKSGIGALDLILKHPDVFSKAGVWDFPDVVSSSQHGYDSSDAYGPDEYFQTHDRLTPQFLEQHSKPFRHDTRIVLGGCSAFCTDVKTVSQAFDAAGIKHLTGQLVEEPHRWSEFWVSRELTSLESSS